MSVLRVLLVEDSLPRLSWFRDFLTGCVVDYCWTVSEAIELLQKNEYDNIFLDHDLCDEHYDYLFNNKPLTEEMIEQTGTGVARWLEKNPSNNKNAHIIIHSLNEAGQQRIKSYLKYRRVDILPYNKLKVQLRLNGRAAKHTP